MTKILRKVITFSCNTIMAYYHLCIVVKRPEEIAIEAIAANFAMINFITFFITILRASATTFAEIRRQLAFRIAGASAVGDHIGRAAIVACGISLAPFIAPFPVVKARRGISRLGDGKNEQRQ